MLQIPLAYKYVTVMAMMAQVNYYAPRLHLPIHAPFNDSDIKHVIVIPPIIETNMQDFMPLNMEICGGALRVKNYNFTCGVRSLAIVNLAEDGLQSYGIPMDFNESSHSALERASRMKYQYTTNDVYGMATNCLLALDIDLQSLERTNPPQVDASMFHSDRGLVPSPLLLVEWKKPNFPGYEATEVKAEFSAVSGELLQFTDGDGTFSKHTMVNNLEKLLAISDKEFQNYSTLERSNLLVNFAGIHCSDLRCPGIADALPPASNAVDPANVTH